MSDSNIKIIKTDASTSGPDVESSKKVNFASPPPSEKNPLINDDNDLVEFNPDDLVVEDTSVTKEVVEENGPPEASEAEVKQAEDMAPEADVKPAVGNRLFGGRKSKKQNRKSVVASKSKRRKSNKK